MPAFQLLRCMIALGGDDGTTVYRDRTRPIVFPELPILQFLHGEEAITEVHVVGTWDAPNDEVLTRLQTIYQPEAVQAVFPGARPRLPVSDTSIPRCTLPVYKPRPVRPDSPDPKLRPLDQFTAGDREVLDAPALPAEDEPTADEIAAHAQDDEDQDDMGLGPAGPPRPEDIPYPAASTAKGSGGGRASASRTPSTLPDVAGGINRVGSTGKTREVEVR